MENTIKDVITTFIKANVLMVGVQTVAVIVVFYFLAKGKASDTAYKMFGAIVFLGSGITMAYFGVIGWFMFALECILTIPLLAIHKGYAFTSPKVEIMGLDENGNPYRKIGSQPYLGPAPYTPYAAQIAKALNQGEPPPRIDQSFIPELPDEQETLRRQFAQRGTNGHHQ
jgi:hypothetical protein